VSLTRDQKFELIGGLSGAAIAYGGVALGVSAGWFNLGVLLLVVTVPVGVTLGWLLAKLLKVAAGILNE
jgi:ethanolamine transporter EutH